MPGRTWAAASRCACRGGALRILVADDNVDAADSLGALLEAGGHTVRTVYDGAQAVRLAPGCAPDLAFLDIGMPGMDGYQAAHALRALPQLAGLHLVALTGWGAREDRARSRAAGFDQHLLKPAAPEHLARILAGAGQTRV